MPTSSFQDRVKYLLKLITWAYKGTVSLPLVESIFARVITKYMIKHIKNLTDFRGTIIQIIDLLLYGYNLSDNRFIIIEGHGLGEHQYQQEHHHQASTYPGSITSRNAFHFLVFI